jgi:hypothetical protein
VDCGLRFFLTPGPAGCDRISRDWSGGVWIKRDRIVSPPRSIYEHTQTVQVGTLLDCGLWSKDARGPGSSLPVSRVANFVRCPYGRGAAHCADFEQTLNWVGI